MKGKRTFFVVSFIWVISVLTVIFVSSGCTPVPASTSSSTTNSKEIRIGILLPLTGPHAAIGKSFRDAIELALKLDNQQINGKTIRIIIEDEGGEDHALALEKAKKLVQSDKVGLILGPVNDESSLAVMPYTSSLPMVNLKWGVPVSNKSELGNSYTFWTTPMYQDITYPLGLYVYNQGIDKVTILGTNQSLALDFVEGFKSGFRINNGTIVQEQWTALEEPTYIPFLKNLFPADALICATLGDKAKTKLLREYEELGLFKKAPVFIAETGSLSPSTLKEMDTFVAGVTSVERYLPDLSYPENIRYIDAYREAYQQDPPDLAVDAYNCMRVALEALKKTGGDPNPEILKDALLDLKIDLPTGPFIFSEGRVGSRTFFIREVVNEGDILQWQIKKEYSLIKTHQQTYP